jgi:hypothetical protein
LTLKGRLRGGKKGGVNSKRMTPKENKDVDESKNAVEVRTEPAAVFTTDQRPFYKSRPKALPSKKSVPQINIAA